MLSYTSEYFPPSCTDIYHEPFAVFCKNYSNLIVEGLLYVLVTKLKMYMLNCKINSTKGGTFSNSAEKMVLIFFFFRGPK